MWLYPYRYIYRNLYHFIHANLLYYECFTNASSMTVYQQCIHTSMPLI